MWVLFEPEPERWGLRGDPHLWRAMKHRLKATEIPATEREVRELLAAVFLRIVGSTHEATDPEAHVFVEELAHGGMSSGHVLLGLWRDELIPLLVGRSQEARQGQPPEWTEEEQHEAEADSRRAGNSTSGSRFAWQAGDIEIIEPVIADVLIHYPDGSDLPAESLEDAIQTAREYVGESDRVVRLTFTSNGNDVESVVAFNFYQTGAAPLMPTEIEIGRTPTPRRDPPTDEELERAAILVLGDGLDGPFHRVELDDGSQWDVTWNLRFDPPRVTVTPAEDDPDGFDDDLEVDDQSQGGE